MGKTALAAVTIGGVIANMVVNFFNGMSVGANVVISRAFGKNDVEALRDKACVAFTFAVLLGVFLSFLGIVFTPQLLRFAGAQSDYWADALDYLRIYLAGLMFTVIYNNGAGVLRAIGDSRTPFRILFLACCLNIVLDLAFVGWLRLGTKGVALATIFSQGLSVVLSYRAINKVLLIRCINFRKLFSYGLQTVGEILSVGMIAGLQSALIGFSNLFVTRYINLFESAAVAGIGVAQNIDKFVILPAKAFGITMTTYISQNIGARSFERVRNGKIKCLLIALSVTIGISSLVYLFADFFVSLFNPDPEVVSVGRAMVRVMAPMVWSMAVREVYLGILRGYGKNVVPMILSLFGMVAIRQIYLAITMRGDAPVIANIYFCYPIGWVATMGMLIAYYLIVKKNFKGLN